MQNGIETRGNLCTELGLPVVCPDFEREKTTTKSCLFRRYFLCFTHVDNRERARASD